MNVEKIENTTSVSIDFLDNLRSKTAVSHKKLESLPISTSIIDPEITLSEYASYLSCMHDVVANLENSVYPIVSDILSDIDERKKAHLIVNDLVVINSNKTQSHNPFQEIHEISVPFAMGMLYVIEGSTLGGRFILKNIQENLGFDESNGASYFAGYKNKTGVLWKSLLNSLTEFEKQSNSQSEIICGADYAFEMIYNHLSKNATNQ